jgi:hypothetical protein
VEEAGDISLNIEETLERVLEYCQVLDEKTDDALEQLVAVRGTSEVVYCHHAVLTYQEQQQYWELAQLRALGYSQELLACNPVYTDVPAWPDFAIEQEAPWNETPVVYFLDCSGHIDRVLTPEAFDIWCKQIHHIFNNEFEFVLVFGNTGDRPYPKENAPRPKSECRVAGGAAHRTYYHARMTYLRETYLALQA